MKYIGRFRHTGSLCPSSELLAHSMFVAASGFFEDHDEIFFAGIGSGVIARLFAKVDKRVVFIDIDHDFCHGFKHHAGARHEVVCEDLGDYLGRLGTASSRRLIVSCLPMRGAFRSDALRKALLDQVCDGATVVFYSYLPFPPWRSRDFRGTETALRVERRAAVLRNIPPAFVFSLEGVPRLAADGAQGNA